MTEEQCSLLLAHWQDRETWFRKPDGYDHPEKSELWHGKRFQELSYFWDTSKQTLLPERCPSCSSIIPSKKIQSEIDEHRILDHETSTICVTCSTYATEVTVLPQYMNGDPRNQAIVIHYDGWNPNTSSSDHSVAAITIAHACMSKVNRAESKYARVYSFIPVWQLPKDAPHKLDAFLEPLITELEDLYIYGQEVFFKQEVTDLLAPKDTANLRAIPLLLTADMKAHAEVGLTTAGGYKGCRRCFVSGTYVPERRHHYYHNFQHRYRFPAQERTAEQNRMYGKEVDGARNASQKEQLRK